MTRHRHRPNHRGGQKRREQAQQDVEAAAKRPSNKGSSSDGNWKPRDPRRGRSEKAYKANLQKYLTPGGAFDNGQRYWARNTDTMIRGEEYPTDFLSGPQIIGRKFPGAPADLPLFTEDNSKVVLVSGPPPTTEEEALSENGTPPFDVGRFPNTIPPYVQRKLLAAWDRVQALQPRYGLGEQRRSASPALHLGVWERYADRPIITGDSRQINTPVAQRQELVEALHDLCGVIKQYVVPKVRSIVEWYYPGQEWLWDAMNKRIQRHLSKDLEKYPNFDFGGYSRPETIHVDWFDNLNQLAWVMAIGPFEGANFAGDLLGARTRFLGHCCAPFTGRRIAFTFFIDGCLFERTMSRLS
ncbi:hypothetical protein B0H13DRAFT_2048858 [Mycena leptocephala]|nr:hypothetical protein B0H13DRAFT_2048858 [Mycena leptocephala]